MEPGVDQEGIDHKTKFALIFELQRRMYAHTDTMPLSLRLAPPYKTFLQEQLGQKKKKTCSANHLLQSHKQKESSAKSQLSVVPLSSTSYLLYHLSSAPQVTKQSTAGDCTVHCRVSQDNSTCDVKDLTLGGAWSRCKLREQARSVKKQALDDVCVLCA